jgi:hypothetical protein
MLRIRLGADTGRIFAQLDDERAAAPVDPPGELLSLERSEWHAASVGSPPGRSLIAVKRAGRTLRTLDA